jgi:hypothetical protein
VNSAATAAAVDKKRRESESSSRLGRKFLRCWARFSSLFQEGLDVGLEGNADGTRMGDLAFSRLHLDFEL